MAKADNRFLTIQAAVYAVQFFLEHRWPGPRFRVEMQYDVLSMRRWLYIVVPTKDGGASIVTQEVDHEFDHKTFRLSDETLATVTLLLG